VTSVIVDAGPLVALLNRHERHHSWAAKVMDNIEPPMFTCDPVLSEACFLLQHIDGGPDALVELVARGLVRSDFHVMAEVDPIRALMKKFSSVPMSLADACLVRMTELDQKSVVLTLDSDFKIYRRNKRQMVPTLMPHSTGSG
jgi:predicted nucleic acid-binding protein